MGAPSELIEQFSRAQRDGDTFKVWPENWEVVLLFLSCSTQWRFNASGQIYGMDYAGIEAAMNMQNIKPEDRPALFDKLRVMEAAALEVLNV